MISIGNRAVVNKNIQDISGMLYKGTKVKIIGVSNDDIQISDDAGRLFWVKSTDISV